MHIDDDGDGSREDQPRLYSHERTRLPSAEILAESGDLKLHLNAETRSASVSVADRARARMLAVSFGAMVRELSVRARARASACVRS